jgi:hypothetical protein
MPAPATPIIPERRKLLPAVFACVLLGLDEDRVAEVMEDGELWPAFNLSVRPDGRRLLFCWRDGLLRLHAGLPRTTASLDEVLAAILPVLGNTLADKATIGGTELAWRWSCGRDRIWDLIRNGELREVGHRPHCRATPRLAYCSVVEFLKRRVVA